MMKSNAPKAIDIEAAKAALNYDPDTGIFTWRISTNGRIKVGDVAGNSEIGYVRISVDGKRYLAHRLAWAIYYGEQPPKHIDHKNEIKTDSRICNLRGASFSQNLYNKGVQRNNALGFKWVHQHKNGSFVAVVNSQYLGCYDTAESAHAIALKYAKAHHGDFLHASMGRFNARSETGN